MTGSQSLASSTPELLGRLTFKRVVSVALVTFAASVLFVGLAAADIVPLEIVLAVPFAVGAVGVAVLLVRPVTNEAAAEADDPTAGSEQTQAEVPTEHGAAVARHEVERAHVRVAEVVPDAPAELTVITESGATFKFKGAFERADEAKIRIYEDHEEEVSTPPRPPMEHVRPTVESSTRAELRAPSVGESLVGDGNEVAHIDLLIGAKAGPVGKAFAGALVNQKEGHTNLLAVVAPNLPAKPDTIIANKVTIKSEKQVGHMFGPAQAAVARAVVDSVRDGVIPEAEVEDLCIIVGVFIHWLAEDNKKIFDWNYEATKESIRRAMAREPTASTVIEQEPFTVGVEAY